MLWPVILIIGILTIAALLAAYAVALMVRC